MTDQCREAFEKWVSKKDWFIATLGLGRSGVEYVDPCINSRWQGWQAAWNTRAQSSAPEGGEAVAEITELDNEFGPGAPCIMMLAPMPPLGTKLYTRSNDKGTDV